MHYTHYYFIFGFGGDNQIFIKIGLYRPKPKEVYRGHCRGTGQVVSDCVGGGATFAALVVLPAMGFPVALVALLISIEPLIDMARTALNVNGAITTNHKI